MARAALVALVALVASACSAAPPPERAVASDEAVVSCGGLEISTCTTETDCTPCERIDGAECPLPFDPNPANRVVCVPPTGLVIPSAPDPRCTAGIYQGLPDLGMFLWACPVGTPTWALQPGGAPVYPVHAATQSQTDCGTCYGPLPDGYAYYWSKTEGTACTPMRPPAPAGWACDSPGSGCPGGCNPRSSPYPQ